MFLRRKLKKLRNVEKDMDEQLEMNFEGIEVSSKITKPTIRPPVDGSKRAIKVKFG